MKLLKNCLSILLAVSLCLLSEEPIRFMKNRDGTDTAYYIRYVQGGAQNYRFVKDYSGRYLAVYVAPIDGTVYSDTIIAQSDSHSIIRYNSEKDKWEFTNDGTNWYEIGAGGGLWTDQGTYIYPNNYSDFVITDAGKVGIGFTDPGSAKLAVNGSIFSSGEIFISPSTPNSAQLHLYNKGNVAEWYIGQPSGTNHKLYFRKYASNSFTDLMTLDTDGHLNLTGNVYTNGVHATQSIYGARLCLGPNNSINLYNAALAVGYSVQATGNYSFAQGEYSKATVDQAFAQGFATEASGINSHAEGQNTKASAMISHAEGYYGHAYLYNQYTHGLGGYNNLGAFQYSRLVAKNTTSDATATSLFLDGSSARMVLPASCTWGFRAFVTGRASDGTSSYWELKGAIKRDGSNNTTLVGTVSKTTIAQDTGASAWDVNAVADDTNEALNIQVTGASGVSIRWCAVVELVEVRY